MLQANRKGQKLISSFFTKPTKRVQPSEDSAAIGFAPQEEDFTVKKVRLDEGEENSPPVVRESSELAENSNLNPSNKDNHPHPAEPSGLSVDFPSTSKLKQGDSGLPSRDIGDYIGQNISDYTKTVLLENPWTPPDDYEFPHSTRTVSGQVKKNFLRPHHLKKYDWLVLSSSKRGLFCKYCPWFTNRNEGGFCKNVTLKTLVTVPLTNFKKLTGADGVLEKHSILQYHKDAVLAGKVFLKTYHNPKHDVSNIVNGYRLNLSQENRKRLLPIVKTIIMLGRQNIPLRGHRDDGIIEVGKTPLHNEGNFRALLRFRVDAGDTDLESHLKNSSSRATYISKSTQNDIIDCCRLEITESIINRILKSLFFSIIFDETPDISGKEQITLVVRYMNVIDTSKKFEIREDFLTFIDAFGCLQSARKRNEQVNSDENESDDSDSADKVGLRNNSSSDQAVEIQRNELSLTGKSLGQIVLGELQAVQLPLEKCVGIGTDGCTVMISDNMGAVREIQNTAKNAIRTPCYNHKLNLSISQCAKITSIEKTVCLMKEVTSFFSFPKRATVLNAHIGGKLKRLCETRWVERHDGVLQFVSTLPSIVKTLDEISEWKDKTSAGKAAILSEALCDSEFLVGLFCLSDVLARTLSLSTLLQKESLDLAKAAQVVKCLISDLKTRRSEAKSHFENIFRNIEEMAKTLNVDIRKPRTCGRQTKRANYEIQNPEDYFRISSYVPLLDSVCADLNMRFSSDALDAFKLPLLLPESIVKLSVAELDELIHCIINRFSSLLSCNKILETMKLKGEASLWQQKWKNGTMNIGEIPPSISAIDALNGCDKDIFPTIHTLLQVLCTLPVSNASAERSFSSLRRLKSWTRSTMVQKRLVGLALLHIHHDIIVEPKNVIDRFAKSKTHRLCL